jgi:hypothetical protein
MRVYITRRFQTAMKTSFPIVPPASTNSLAGLLMAIANMNFGPAIGGPSNYAALQAANFPNYLELPNTSNLSGITIVGVDENNNVVNIPFKVASSLITFGGGTRYGSAQLLTSQFPNLSGQGSLAGYDNGDIAFTPTINRTSIFPNGQEEIISNSATTVVRTSSKGNGIIISTSIPQFGPSIQYVCGAAGVSNTIPDPGFSAPAGTKYSDMVTTGFSVEYFAIDIDDNYLTVAQSSGQPMYAIASGPHKNYFFYSSSPAGWVIGGEDPSNTVNCLKIDGQTGVSGQAIISGDLETEAAVSMGKVDTTSDLFSAYQSNPVVATDGNLL